MQYDTIIIGHGPAGLSAAMYAGRFTMKTLVVGVDFGGYASKSGVIMNYPGLKNIEGYDLAKAMKDQGIELGVDFMDEEVSGVERVDGLFNVKIKEDIFQSKTLILATGSERRTLGLPNEKDLEGKGIHYCVTCDGPVYTGKTIAVVGGGNAGVKGVIQSSEYAKKIYFLVSGKELKADPSNIETMNKIGDKLEVLFETKAIEVRGEGKLESITLDKEVNGSKELRVDALFVEIGSNPANKIATSLGVLLDEKGYINTNPKMETNIPGLFAAGDISNLFGSFKQNITAAAMGAVSANSAYQYIKLN